MHSERQPAQYSVSHAQARAKGRRHQEAHLPPSPPPRTPTKSRGGGQGSVGGGRLITAVRSSEDETMIEMAPFKEVNENEEKTMVDNPIITKEF